MPGLFYPYDPSLPAAIVAIIVFSISAVAHSVQLFKSRAWYFMPFLVGCTAADPPPHKVEAVGYVGRAIGAKQSPNWTLGPFAMQILLLLLGPTCYAASIYMILGRLIRSLGAETHSLIRTTWLTKFFLLGDVMSIAAQGIGGGILANADTLDELDRGQMIVIIGLAIQVLFFSLFMVVTGLFHYRIKKEPTVLSSQSDASWQKLLVILYSTSILILIRSLFRMIEYILGHDSVLQSDEIFSYIFDGLLMAAVAIIFNFFHPSGLLGIARKPSLDLPNSEIQLGTYDAVPLATDRNGTYGQYGQLRE